jgi:hypothetical protein
VDELETEWPWLRVDIELHARLPLDESQKMPGKPTWRRFLAAVQKKVAPLLPVYEIEFNDGPVVLGWCGQPELRAICHDDGEVMQAPAPSRGIN